MRSLLEPGLLQSANYTDRTFDSCEYHFPHLTLQEFFAARYLKFVYARQNEAPVVINNIPVIKFEKFFRANKYNPRYDMVFRFTAGLFEDNKKTKRAFFNLITQEPTDVIGFKEQILLVNCLEECQLKLKNEQLDKLLEKISIWLKNVLNDFIPGHELIETLRYCPHVVKSPWILNRFISASNESDNKSKKTIIKHLSWLIPKTEATAILTMLALFNTDETIQLEALDALIETPSIDQQLLPNLLDLLFSSKIHMIKKRIINVMGKLSYIPEEAITFIVRLSHREENDHGLQSTAIDLLNALQNNFSFITNVLLEILIKSRLNDVKTLILTNLKIRAESAENIYSILIKFIDDIKNEELLKIAFRVLLNLGQIIEKSLQVIINILKNPQDLRYILVVSILGDLEYPQDKVYAEIFSILTNSKDQKVLNIAISSGKKILKYFPKIADVFLKIFFDKSQNESVRISALEAAKNNFSFSKELILSCRELTEMTKNNETKKSIVQIISSIEHPSADSISELIGFYTSDQYTELKFSLVRELIRISKTSNEISNLLSQEILENKISFSYPDFGRFRGKLVISQEAISFLSQLAMYSPSRPIRRSSVFMLASLYPISPYILSILLKIARWGDKDSADAAGHAITLISGSISIEQLLDYIKNDNTSLYIEVFLFPARVFAYSMKYILEAASLDSAVTGYIRESDHLRPLVFKFIENENMASDMVGYTSVQRTSAVFFRGTTICLYDANNEGKSTAVKLTLNQSKKLDKIMRTTNKNLLDGPEANSNKLSKNSFFQDVTKNQVSSEKMTFSTLFFKYNLRTDLMENIAHDNNLLKTPEGVKSRGLLNKIN